MSIKSEFVYIEEAKEQLASALISKFGVQEQDALNEDGTVKTKGLYTVNSDGTKNYLKRLHDWTALVTATSTGITSLAGLKFTDDYDSASGPGITYYGTNTYTVSYKTVGAAAASHSHSKITNTVGTSSLTMSLAPVSMYGADSQYYINFGAGGTFTANEIANTSVKTFPSLILGQDILGSYIPETIYFGTKQAQTTLVASGYKVPNGSSTKLLASDGSTVDANSLVDQVSNAVTLTGNQNVTGVKSFSDVVISSTSKSYILYDYVSSNGLTSANLGAIGFIPDITKDPVTVTNGGQAVRWDSDRNTYVILDTSSTYIKDGTITINGVPITPLVASDITNKIDYSNAVTEIGTKDKQLTWKKGDTAQTALTIPYATIADHLEVNKIEAGDFDKFYHDFKVSYRGGSNGFTSNPEKDNGFGVMQLRVADGYSGQIALSHTGTLYTRTAADSSFSSGTTWRTIGDSHNIQISKNTSISAFGATLEALPNPNSITVFGVEYTGKAKATVNESTLIELLTSGDVTDDTEIITSGKTAFKDALHKNKVSDLLAYVRAKTGTLTLQINGNTQETYNTTNSPTFNVSLGNLGAVNKDGDEMTGSLTTPELITSKITSKDPTLSIYTTKDEKSVESLKISDGGISTGKITISDTKTGFLKTNGNVDYTVYAKNEHKHNYSDLTGSTTEENQVIISTGTADNWTLKTLNISNWDDAYAFYQEITNKDDEPDKTINKWSEIVDFLDGIDSTAEGSQTLKQLLEAATNAAVTALSWDDTKNQLQWTKAGDNNPLEIKYATTAGNLTAWTTNNPGEGLYLTHESNATDSQGNAYSANVINIKTSNSTSQLRLDYGSTSGQAANIYYQSDANNAWDRLLFAREFTAFKNSLSSLKYRTIEGRDGTYNPTDTNDSNDLTNGIYYAALPIGFDSQDTTFSDGPSGTPLTSWHKTNGGSIAFYNNDSKLDLVVDGHLYIQKNIPVLGSITDGTYWGICTSDGNDEAAIRTTSTGILPHESSATGASSIGSSDWYFKESYIKTMHGTAEKADGVKFIYNSSNDVKYVNFNYNQLNTATKQTAYLWGYDKVDGVNDIWLFNSSNLKVGYADTLNGYHASDLLDSVTNSNYGITVTVGGSPKSASNISVAYASKIIDCTNEKHSIQVGYADTNVTSSQITRVACFTGYCIKDVTKDTFKSWLGITDSVSIDATSSGNGNAVTSVSFSGNELTYHKDTTFLTSGALDGYAKQSWVTEQGYLTEHQSLKDYMKNPGTSALGSDTNGIYWDGSSFKTMTYNLHATVDAGKSNRLAYYSNDTQIGAISGTVGCPGVDLHIDAGVVTEDFGTIKLLGVILLTQTSSGSRGWNHTENTYISVGSFYFYSSVLYSRLGMPYSVGNLDVKMFPSYAQATIGRIFYGDNTESCITNQEITHWEYYFPTLFCWLSSSYSDANKSYTPSSDSCYLNIRAANKDNSSNCSKQSKKDDFDHIATIYVSIFGYMQKR